MNSCKAYRVVPITWQASDCQLPPSRLHRDLQTPWVPGVCAWSLSPTPWLTLYLTDGLLAKPGSSPASATQPPGQAPSPLPAHLIPLKRHLNGSPPPPSVEGHPPLPTKAQKGTLPSTLRAPLLFATSFVNDPLASCQSRTCQPAL